MRRILVGIALLSALVACGCNGSTNSSTPDNSTLHTVKETVDQGKVDVALRAFKVYMTEKNRSRKDATLKTKESEVAAVRSYYADRFIMRPAFQSLNTPERERFGEMAPVQFGDGESSDLLNVCHADPKQVWDTDWQSGTTIYKTPAWKNLWADMEHIRTTIGLPPMS